MDNPEKLATLGTQDTRRRKTKQYHNTISAGHHYGKTNKNNVIRHKPSFKQLEVKTNRLLCGNRNGHHNTELKM